MAAGAIAASMHVVLTKRNVSSAVAWVGLIWLAPVVGVVLYTLIGINRIHRRASALRSGARALDGPDPAACKLETVAEALGSDNWHLLTLVRLGGRVAGSPLLAGNRVTPLVDGDAAYPSMLEAIDEARSSITLTTYIFDNDRTGRVFRDALLAAKLRGVEIRVLIDDVGARYSFPSMPRVLRRSGIRTARFIPVFFPWRMPYSNLRSHRKIMVVDGQTGFTGGINIREGHWLATEPSHPVRDLHFRVEGPIVGELQRVFAEDWLFTTGEALEGPRWFAPSARAGDTIARGLSDGPDADFEKLSTMILGALAAARHSVRIVTPYFVPDPTLITALNVTALRGVDVQIVLPEHNNLTLVQWASRAHWWQLLEKGCRILLTPSPFDHAKIMLVDGAWALVGSANWDARSLLLSFEFNVECYDRELAFRLGTLADERVAAAREVTLDEVRSYSLPVRLRDGLARLLSPYL